MLLDDLIGLGLGGAGFEFAGPEDGHGFGHEARTGKEPEDLLPGLGGVTGFFQEFAFGGGKGSFAFVDAAGGQFPKIAVGGMPILALEKNESFPRALERSENHYGPAMAHNFAKDANAGGLLNTIGGHPECGTRVDQTARENPGRLSPFGAPRFRKAFVF